MRARQVGPIQRYGSGNCTSVTQATSEATLMGKPQRGRLGVARSGGLAGDDGVHAELVVGTGFGVRIRAPGLYRHEAGLR